MMVKYAEGAEESTGGEAVALQEVIDPHYVDTGDKMCSLDTSPETIEAIEATEEELGAVRTF